MVQNNDLFLCCVVQLETEREKLDAMKRHLNISLNEVLTHTHSHTHSLTQSHTHTLTQSHTHSHSHTHTHTHTSHT